MNLYIVNRDWLTTTRDIVVAAERWHATPIIVDCASTYPPLLDWYDSQPCRIVRAKNHGPAAPWYAGLASKESDDYAVTDADLDVAGLPDDTLDHLAAGLRQFPEAIRAGVSLRIDDLPDEAPLTADVIRWEKRWWVKPLDPYWYDAAVGCTLAVYRHDSPWPYVYTPAVRAAPPYVARHAPWYITPTTLTEEQRYALTHTDHDRPCWTPKLRDALCLTNSHS